MDLKQPNSRRPTKAKGSIDVELLAAAFALPGVSSSSAQISAFAGQENGGPASPIGSITTRRKRVLNTNVPNSYELHPQSENSRDSDQPAVIDNTDNTDSYDKVRQLIFSRSLNDSVGKAELEMVNFNDIAEIDANELLEMHITMDFAFGFGESDTLRLLMLCVIIANCIIIGIQTDRNLVHSAAFYAGFDVFSLLNYIFLALYVMEIVLKWFYGFIEFFKLHWNLLDFVITAAQLYDPSGPLLLCIGVLRLVRVVRPTKSIRSAQFLTGLHIVVQTILDSLQDMFNIIVLLAIIFYAYSVIGVCLFRNVDHVDFSSIHVTFYTLFVTVTQIGWLEVHDHLEHEGYGALASIYFATFLIIAAFVFMKIVIAVVVSNLEESYKLWYAQKKSSKRRLKSNKSVAGGQSSSKRDVENMPKREHHVWKTQIPVELPNFDNVTQDRLKKYLLVLAIIEENLSEYMSIKEELRKIHIDVKQLNKKLDHYEHECRNRDLSGMSSNPDLDGIQNEDDVLYNLTKMRLKNK